MSVWKVLFIAVFACVCLALAFATAVVPTTAAAADNKWAWGAACLAATVVMVTLFILFLRWSDRTFSLSSPRYTRR
jgi:membrane protein YdbS with pleckstrin-like domain